jgi:16S rRNA (cytosine967-C5)-methyltransferase
MNARRAALLTLMTWESGDRKVDAVFERHLSDGVLDDRETALAQNLVYGVLRWKGRIDWVLDQYVKGGLRSLPVPIRNALRLGLYQIDHLDRIPPRAAVNESVTLARMYGHAGTAGLVNAVLRNILTSLRPDFPSIESDPAGHVSAVHSHPRVLVERWIERYGLDMAVVLCEYDNQVPRLVVRGNALACTTAALAAALHADGRESSPGRYFPECLEVGGGGDVARLQSFASGLFQVQDESTLAAVRLLDPKRGERIIDMCAAPGGKTTYAAALMGGKGLIRAFEVSAARARLLKENLRRLGVPNCEVTHGEATAASTEPADGVLVDAPCTGTGTLGRRIDSRWKFDLLARERMREDVEDLQRMHPRQLFAAQASRQLRLLMQGADLVRPGGRLVYSTCSLEPEENEQVVERFLAKRTDFVIEPPSARVPEVFVDGPFVRILPQRHGIDGAFAVRFARVEEGGAR